MARMIDLHQFFHVDIEQECLCYSLNSFGDFMHSTHTCESIPTATLATPWKFLLIKAAP